jgi:D-psicose/D-tagatose/L-ribulose 3-epimerase
MFRFGVDTFIWSEVFTEQDLWIINKAKDMGFTTVDFAIAHPETFPAQAVRERLREVGDIDPVTSVTLNDRTNPISPSPDVRKAAAESLKTAVDINQTLGSRILGGVNYASWGYLTRKPRTHREWDWSVAVMREVCEYAKGHYPELTICVEPVNRFETHFLNVAEDAVRYCRDVGTGNIRVHLDSFHMIREERSFAGAVEECGKEYLGYVHVCESNRGIPGTGLVPWKEFFTAIRDIGYSGPLVIESFDPDFEELNALCAIWRRMADSGEELARQGLANLSAIAAQIV